MLTGFQEPAPSIDYVPLHMEFDILSTSIIMIVKGWVNPESPVSLRPVPRALRFSWPDSSPGCLRYPPTNPAITNDVPSRQILSLIAVNETTGVIVDPPHAQEDPPDPNLDNILTDTVYSVTFCRACPTGLPEPNTPLADSQACALAFAVDCWRPCGSSVFCRLRHAMGRQWGFRPRGLAC